MTLADLAGYRPVERTPLCHRYRVTLICVPPPPSSGVAVLQLMALLERIDIGARVPPIRRPGTCSPRQAG